jgi:hypothetical protein
MELLDGGSLDKLQFARPTSLDRLLDLGIQAAGAMDAAHRKGIRCLILQLAKITEPRFPVGAGRFSTGADNDATAAHSLTSAGQHWEPSLICFRSRHEERSWVRALICFR